MAQARHAAKSSTLADPVELRERARVQREHDDLQRKSIDLQRKNDALEQQLRELTLRPQREEAVARLRSRLAATPVEHCNIPAQVTASAELLQAFKLCHGVDLNNEQRRMADELASGRAAALLAKDISDDVYRSSLCNDVKHEIRHDIGKLEATDAHQTPVKSMNLQPVWLGRDCPPGLDVFDEPGEPQFGQYAILDVDVYVRRGTHPAWVTVSDKLPQGDRSRLMWGQAVGVFRAHALASKQDDGWMRPVLAIDVAATPGGTWHLRLLGYCVCAGSEGRTAYEQAARLTSTVIMECDGRDTKAVSRMLMAIVMHATRFAEVAPERVVNASQKALVAGSPSKTYRIFDERQEARQTGCLAPSWYWQLAMEESAELLVLRQVVLIRQNHFDGDEVPSCVAELIAVLEHLKEVHARKVGSFGRAVSQIMHAGGRQETWGTSLPPSLRRAVKDLQRRATKDSYETRLKVCHGDVRGANMVFCHEDPSRSRLTNFGSAGWEGHSSYPADYSPELVVDGGRHVEATGGRPRRQAHDVWAFGEVMCAMADQYGVYGKMCVSEKAAKHWRTAYRALQGKRKPADAIRKALTELRKVRTEPIAWKDNNYDYKGPGSRGDEGRSSQTPEEVLV